MALNTAALYQGTKVSTATPAELTLMLYDGAIKFCNRAVYALEDNDIQKSHENLCKAQKIIIELWGTLDYKYPVAKDYDKIYDYIYYRLVQANIKKDKEMLEEALTYIREMRDTWKEIMKKNNIPVK